MDSAPRVAIILDHPLRDLPALSLLALELSRRGCRTFLVPMYLNGELLSLAPDFVLLNYLRKVSTDIARQLTANNIPFGSLDTEGGPNSDIEKNYVYYLCDDAAVNHQARCICSWGSEIANALIAKKHHAEGAVTVTGQPRYDLYSEPWRRAVVRLSDHIPADLDPFILICSNFGMTNSKYADRAQVVKSLAVHYQISEEQVLFWQVEEDRCIEQLTQCVRDLAARFPAVRFVYRPHPFEDIDFYKTRFADFPNILVSKTNEVAGWLLRAKAAIQLNCTTSYDAWFAGTPSFKPQWIQQTIGVSDDLTVNDPCDTIDELAAKLAAAIEAKGDRDKTGVRELALVDRFFGLPDGLAYRRVVDTVTANLDLAGRPERLRRLRQVGPSRKWPLLRHKLLAQAMRLVGFQSTWQPDTIKERHQMLRKYQTSEKCFSADQVRKWIDTLADAGGVERPKVGKASKLGQYQFGGLFGEAIAIEPLRKRGTP